MYEDRIDLVKKGIKFAPSTKLSFKHKNFVEKCFEIHCRNIRVESSGSNSTSSRSSAAPTTTRSSSGISSTFHPASRTKRRGRPNPRLEPIHTSPSEQHLRRLFNSDCFIRTPRDYVVRTMHRVFLNQKPYRGAHVNSLFWRGQVEHEPSPLYSFIHLYATSCYQSKDLTLIFCLSLLFLIDCVDLLPTERWSYNVHCVCLWNACKY